MPEVILLIKNPKTKDLSEFNDLIKTYEKAQFKINLFEDYDNSIGVREYKTLANYMNKGNLSDYDIVTDDYALLLCWFRIYQNLFRNFILLFQDNISMNLNVYPLEEKKFYSSLIELKGLSKEDTHKSIFINIGPENYSKILGEMLKSAFYLKPISEFNVEQLSKSTVRNKRYYLNKNEYIDFALGKAEEEFYDVNLYHNDFILERLLSLNNNNAKIVTYLVYYILKNNQIIDTQNVIKYIISNNNEADNNIFVSTIIENVGDIQDLRFIDKINILFILLSCYKANNKIVEKIWSLIEMDDTDIFRHQNIVKNLNVMMFRKEINAKDLYYQYMRKATLKITEEYKKIFNIPQREGKKSDRIVILIDQLLGEYHAPTKVLIKLCDQLLLSTNYQLDIVVEENLIPSPEEKFSTEYFQANNSLLAKEKHEQYFNKNKIRIFYSNTEESRVNRIKKQLEFIMGSQPDIIFSLSSFSLVQNLLYTIYPIVYYSFGTEYSPGLADLYLYKNQKKALEIEKLGEFKDTSNILHFMNDTIFHESKKTITRGNMGLGDEDFIIITVGNRLDTELDDELLQNIIPILKDDERNKWLIVSPALPKSILLDYKNLLGVQIIHLKFEEDLLALTTICDVYLNPNRIGGGYSVSAAMKVGIPVLTTTFESDGLIAVGRENSSGDTYGELMIELTRLKNNTNYWNIKSDAMKKRIKEREAKSSIEQLINFFEFVKERY